MKQEQTGDAEEKVVGKWAPPALLKRWLLPLALFGAILALVRVYASADRLSGFVVGWKGATITFSDPQLGLAQVGSATQPAPMLIKLQVQCTPAECLSLIPCEVTSDHSGFRFTESPDDTSGTAKLMVRPTRDGWVAFYGLLPQGASPGQLYSIVVKAKAASSSTQITIPVRSAEGAPANDRFADRARIAESSGMVVGHNLGATLETGEPAPISQCDSTVWYRWTAPASAKYKFTTWGSHCDTGLSVFTGEAVDNLTEVASNDEDTSDNTGTGFSTLEFNALRGTEYQVSVGAVNQPGNSFKLAWSRLAPASNDDLSSATIITTLTGTDSAHNISCTKEPDEPDHAASTGGSSCWFSWTPARSGRASFAVEEPTFPSMIAVYKGATLGALEEIAANLKPTNDFSSDVTFRADAGTTYRIAVDGYHGKNGNFKLVHRLEGEAPGQ